MQFAPPSDQCRGKVRYECRAFAIEARSRLRNFTMQVYHCDGCGGFHIGRPAGSGIKQPYRRERIICLSENEYGADR